MADTLVLPLVDRLVVALVDAFALTADPPAQIGARWGAEYRPLIGGVERSPQDEACMGVVWVRPTGVSDASDGFPSGGASGRPCGPAQWDVHLEVGAARCVPWGTGREGTGLPSQAQWDVMMSVMLGDAATIRAAVRCAFPSPIRVAWGEWVPLGVEGGATGSTIQLNITAPTGPDDCGDCP